MFRKPHGLGFVKQLIGVLLLCLSACATHNPTTSQRSAAEPGRAEVIFQLTDGSKESKSYPIKLPARDQFDGREQTLTLDVKFDGQGKLLLPANDNHPEAELLQTFAQSALLDVNPSMSGKNAIAKIAFKQFADPYSSAIIGRARQLGDDDKPEQALQVLEQVRSQDASSVAVLVLRGELFGKLKDFERAVMFYTQALALAPENERIYYARAYRWKRLKAYDKALADLQRTLEINPTHWETYELLSSTSQEKGNVLDAISYATRGLKYRKDFYFYNKRGWIFLGNENYELALADFKTADSMAANNGSVTSGLARSHYQLKQYDSALAVVNRALQIDGNNVYDLHLKGLVLEELNQLSEAKKCYELVIQELEPTEQTYNNLGWLHILTGNYTEAIRTYGIQLDKGLGSEHQRSNLATAYYLNGDLDKALQAFELAIAEDGDEDVSFGHAWKAQIHIERGELDQAYVSLTYVMNTNPAYYDALQEKANKGANSLPAILDAFMKLAQTRSADDKFAIAKKWKESL